MKQFDKIYVVGMGGWMTVIDREWMAEFFATLKFDHKPVVAELGTFSGGCSLIFWRSFPEGLHHGIDNFSEGPPPAGKTMKEAMFGTLNYYKKDIDPNLNYTFHEGDSKEIGAKWDIKMDICLIDANHHGDYPMEDIKNFGKWVKVGGYLLVDDCGMTDVKSAIDALLKNNANWKQIDKPASEVEIFQKIGEEYD